MQLRYDYRLYPAPGHRQALARAFGCAEQYGRYGVRINTVNPGPVNTDRWDTLEKAFARDKGVTQQSWISEGAQ